jgi:hypothetical protein
MSVIRAFDLGNSIVRTTGLPSGLWSGVPSAATIGTWQPSQVAWWLPLAKLQVAVTR